MATRFALLAMPGARGLFHRAIVQSGPLLRAVPMARATDVAAKALEHLGVAPGRLEALQSVSVAALLAAFAAAGEGAPAEKIAVKPGGETDIEVEAAAAGLVRAACSAGSTDGTHI